MAQPNQLKTVQDLLNHLETLPREMEIVTPQGYNIDSCKPERWVSGFGFLGREDVHKVTLR